LSRALDLSPVLGLDLGLDLTLAADLLWAARASLQLGAFFRALDFFPRYGFGVLAGLAEAGGFLGGFAASASAPSIWRATSAIGAMPSTERNMPWRR
jgi:hypothetical protein